jgi:1-acyl-sn-glycerol-3-phosphate acyltransferase
MRYMAAAGLLRIPILGSWLRALGSFPKMKYVKDPASMATTQALWDQDQLITIFPEGRRTWDGDPTEVSDGIGRLIQRLDARVVFATLENAYLMHPRWARYPRRVPATALRRAFSLSGRLEPRAGGRGCAPAGAGAAAH